MFFHLVKFVSTTGNFESHGLIEAETPEKAAGSIQSHIVNKQPYYNDSGHVLIESNGDEELGWYLFPILPCKGRPKEMGSVRKVKMVAVEVKE